MTEVEHKKLSDLKPDQANANRGTERGRAMLESSLRQWGAGRSILLDKEGRIIAGNKTYEEAGQVGLDDVVIVRTNGQQLVAVLREDLDLSDDATGARELAYADNRVGQVSLDWEPGQVLADLDAGLDMGQFWSEGELNAILAGLDTEPKPDPGPQTDKAAQLAEKWGTQTGQVWQLGEHRLAVGDCTDKAVVEAVMRGEQADACVTDPPYGQNFNMNYTRFTGGLSQSRNFGTSLAGDDKPFDPTTLLDFRTTILWGANYYASNLPVGTWLVWDKRYKGQDKILSDGEIGWVNKGIGVYIYSHGWNGFLRESEKGKTLHPTQKPVALFEWCMKWLNENDEIVFDPYCGSGPVIAACEQLKRKCRAIEIDPGYCAVAIQRWADLTGQEPTLL